MRPEDYREHFAHGYRDRRWIICVDAATGATGLATRIVGAGAAAVMVVAGHEGTGRQPPDEVELFVVGTGGTTLMEAIRQFAETLAEPSRELCAAIESFDPAGDAGILTGYLIPSAELCGRPVHGPARPEWKALEDKLVVDGLWDRCGIARSPSAIVDISDEATVRSALQRMECADGSVIVADNTEGWHGGGEYTRFVAAGADPSPTLAFFEQHSRRVRITPFLRGVPCSIHGLVTPDAVLVFRPVEVLTYRRPASDEFVYAGLGTIWDPPAGIRQEMRRAAQAVGARIRSEVGYLGGFGVDGVCTEEGFLPTELNPRRTSGLSLQAEAAGGYPIDDIDRAIVAGVDGGLELDGLEEAIVSGADAARSGRWMRPVTRRPTGTVDRPIAWDGATWGVTDATGAATATMSLGPAPQGGLVTIRLADDHGLTPGPPLAGIAAAAFGLADDLWNTGVGELLPGWVTPP